VEVLEVDPAAVDGEVLPPDEGLPTDGRPPPPSLCNAIIEVAGLAIRSRPVKIAICFFIELNPPVISRL
jgi:hypothetical protein